jgi:hypothetical protein
MWTNIALKNMGQPFDAKQNLGNSSTWREADLLNAVQRLL